MRYVFALLLLACCCPDVDYDLNLIEVTYRRSLKQPDTLRVIAPEGSRFYLKSYQDTSYLLYCEGVGPITYHVKSFKKLN